MITRKILLTSFLLSCLTLSASESGLRPRENFHPGRLLVIPRTGAKELDVKRLIGSSGGRVIKTLNDGKLQLVTIPPGTTVLQAATNYLASGAFESADPDYVRELNLVPNDPKFVDGTLWALHNTGQGGGLADADIDAPEAWETLTSASNVVVALLDTGIRATHEDLAANVWTNPISGGFGWNSLSNTFFPADDEGHGSLVAGVLGGVGNNGKGITGVAWRVQLMACKCFNSARKGYDSDIIESIEFACTNGAKIINASMGSYDYSSALSNAIYSAREKGIIFVAASGNEGKNIDATPYYPACYDIDNVVSVGFTARDDSFGPISNFGATNVDLAAPGTAMYSTFFSADNMYLGGSFLVGTSFAAPYVSGALALTLSRYPDEPHPKTIKRVLGAVDPVTGFSDRCRTAGRLNVNNIINPPIRLSLVRGDSPGFLIRAHTSPGRRCALQASENFTDWTDVRTTTSSDEGYLEYIDMVTDAGQRYYRVVASE